jgi:hypothetical protein
LKLREHPVAQAEEALALEFRLLEEYTSAPTTRLPPGELQWEVPENPDLAVVVELVRQWVTLVQLPVIMMTVKEPMEATEALAQ